MDYVLKAAQLFGPEAPRWFTVIFWVFVPVNLLVAVVQRWRKRTKNDRK